MGTVLFEALIEHKLVAIFRGVHVEDANQAATALQRAGIKMMETTMNTPGATKMISHWREQFGDDCYIGAGTVLDVEQAKEAVSAGAQFIISPNFDEEVLAYGQEHGLEVWPGVMTPTEIVQAWKAGASAVKLFPMGSLGLKYLKEVRAPLNHIPIMTTGGVDLDNITDFLEAGASAVGMGSNLVNPQLLAQGDFEAVEQKARQFVEKVEAFKLQQHA